MNIGTEVSISVKLTSIGFSVLCDVAALCPVTVQRLVTNLRSRTISTIRLIDRVMGYSRVPVKPIQFISVSIGMIIVATCVTVFAVVMMCGWHAPVLCLARGATWAVSCRTNFSWHSVSVFSRTTGRR